MKNHNRQRTAGSGRLVQPRRSGAAAVEFAIVAPLLIMLLFGSIEFGRALMVQQVLTNASRVGVREAITINGTAETAVAASSEFAEAAAVPGTTVVVTPDPATAGSGDTISVTVSVPFGDVTWVPAPWIIDPNTTLAATSVMRKEGFE